MYIREELTENFKKILEKTKLSSKSYDLDVLELFVDNVDLGIVVVDADYKIVWHNKVIKRWFPQVKLSHKYLCYNIFQDLDCKEPCEVCPVKEAFETKKVQKTQSSANNQRVYKVTASPLTNDKGEVKYVVETLEDITANKFLGNYLDYRYKFENLIAKLATKFINVELKDVDKTINYALREIGKFVGVDRSYIFNFDEKTQTITNTHEWCQVGISSQKHRIQKIPFNNFPWVRKKLLETKILHIPLVSKLPAKAKNIKQELERQGVKSLINIPMFSEGNFIGFVGFDSVKNEKVWTHEHINILKIVSEMFLNIVQRQNTEKILMDNNAKNLSLFEDSPISLWVEDFSAVKRYMDHLKGKGVKDINTYLNQHPEIISYCASMVKILDVNRATLKLYQAHTKGVLLGNLRLVLGKEAYSILKEQLVSIFNGKTRFEAEAINRTLGRKKIYVKLIWSVPPGYSDTYSKVFVSIMDITSKKDTEKEIELLTEKLSKTSVKLKKLSLVDSHTGLYNHRYFEAVIEKEFDRARRFNYPLSVLMIDIDYFKSINDVYGHNFGDLVLKQFAGELKKIVRRYDTVVRFGGEEFVIIFPGTDKTTATVLAERLLDKIGLYSFGNKKNSVKLRLSIAVVSTPQDKAVAGMDLIKTAERILNLLKERGGNNVYSSSDVDNKKVKLSSNKHKRPSVNFLKDKLSKLTKRSNQSLVEAVFAFAKTIKLKDKYTGEHVENTVVYATETARLLGLSRSDVELVKQAAILHDLGKVGVSERILQKKAKLTKKEFDEIKKHPLIAVDIIRPIQFLHSLIPLILHHHERWDGKGYPTGLKKDNIPIGARIIAVADAYHALISTRSYRKAFSKKEAIEIIKRDSGTHFDPQIVEAFLRLLNKKK